MKVKYWIQQYTKSLQQADITSPQLDAELILATVLKKDRPYVHAHPEYFLNRRETTEADALLQRRLKREPLAYILENKEFYGRSFYVTKDVLIPRPESEEIIESLKYNLPHSAIRLLDIGTGSGALGITAKLEFPSLRVTLADISPHALQVARKNAKKLGAHPLRYIQSNLLEHWLRHNKAQPFDAIIANLPYVDPQWECSPETEYEPDLALFAKDSGLSLIKACIDQAYNLLIPKGLLILEADIRQHSQLKAYALKHDFSVVSQNGLIITLSRNLN